MSDAMREALKAAKEKLVLYRADHCGIYIGGVEYTALIKQIDAALAPQPALEARKKCRCHLMDNSCEVHWPSPDCPWCGGKNGEHAIICRSPPQPTSDMGDAPSPALSPATVEALARSWETRAGLSSIRFNAEVYREVAKELRTLLASPGPSDREKLEARLTELSAANEAATSWGAAVGARHEEIKAIKSRLLTLSQTQSTEVAK